MRSVVVRVALVSALLSVAGGALAKPDGTSTMPTKRPSDYEVGKKLWKQSCWQCHGEKGLGDGPAAAALVGGVPSLQGKVKGNRFDALVKVIQSGRGAMPAYAENIDEHDSRRILQYLRDTLEGKAPPPTPEKAADDDEGAGEGQ